MPIEFSISTNSGVPIYRQIVEQVCGALTTGRLAPDEALPSVRALAEWLVVNPNTVARAYGELVREGVVASQPGRGVIVTRRRQVYTKAERSRRIDQAAAVLVNEAIVLGAAVEEIVAAVERKFSELGQVPEGKP